MTYGTTIKRAREARAMTQEQLAEALGVSRQAVSKWEAELSRPARSKLERLSEVLDLPPETWAALDAELAAARVPPDRSRPWRRAAAVLGALCLLLAIALTAVLWQNAHPSTLVPSESAQADGQSVPASAVSPTELVPETLPLHASHDFDFGDAPAGGPFDPSLVPFLDDNLEIQEQELWGGFLEDPESPLSLSVVRVNPVHENGVTFYDVYLLCALPAEDGTLHWQIFTRLADGNHYVSGEEGFRAERFTNVLGYDGWKLSIVIGASAGDLNYYIIRKPDGSPALLTTSCKAREADIDEDGVLEIVSLEGTSYWICEIVDTAEGAEGAFRYTVDPWGDGFSRLGLAFDPDKGGFTAADSQDSVLARYILRDGELVRVPVTDFSVEDYPDAAGTRIHFVTHDGDGLADGREPDDVLYSGGVRITHRQQAYLALQELYRLTGLRVDECCCAANEFGVLFSTLPDGFNQRSFFTADLPEAYGGFAIPSLRFAWKELGNEWSPLSLKDAVQPGDTVPPEDLLRWYYNRLEIFRSGEAARETAGEFPDERNLYLEDGALYVGTFQETEAGLVLESLLGPYPDGQANH